MLWYFCQSLLYNFIQNARFWVPSQHWKEDDVLWLWPGVFLANVMFYYLPHIHRENIRSYWKASKHPLWVIPCHFCIGGLSNCIQKARFWVPYQHKKWDAMLQGEIFIADEVVHILPCIYKADSGSFWHHILAPNESYSAIYVDVDSQIAHKMPDLGYPLGTGKRDAVLQVETYIAAEGVPELP